MNFKNIRHIFVAVAAFFASSGPAARAPRFSTADKALYATASVAAGFLVQGGLDGHKARGLTNAKRSSLRHALDFCAGVISVRENAKRKKNALKALKSPKQVGALLKANVALELGIIAAALVFPVCDQLNAREQASLGSGGHPQMEIVDPKAEPNTSQVSSADVTPVAAPKAGIIFTPKELAEQAELRQRAERLKRLEATTKRLASFASQSVVENPNLQQPEVASDPTVREDLVAERVKRSAAVASRLASGMPSVSAVVSEVSKKFMVGTTEFEVGQRVRASYDGQTDRLVKVVENKATCLEEGRYLVRQGELKGGVWVPVLLDCKKTQHRPTQTILVDVTKLRLVSLVR